MYGPGKERNKVGKKKDIQNREYDAAQSCLSSSLRFTLFH